MKYFSMLIKPASGLCNLACKYCFYKELTANRENSMMSNAVAQACIDLPLKYFESETEISFIFQGGEPTMRGIDFFREFVDKVNELKRDWHHIKYVIQTNGILLDERWLSFFKINEFLVGISVDGGSASHNSFRVSENGNGSFEPVLEAIYKLKKCKIDFNVLTVLTPQLAENPENLFAFYVKEELKHIQIIPCISKLSEYQLTPELFSSFYNRLFKMWISEFKQGNYISIGFFDSVIQVLAGNSTAICGSLGNCVMQFVAEGDGSVYPCDFYVNVENNLGNIKDMTMEDYARSNLLKSFLNQKADGCRLCKDCRYFMICGGQCKRLSSCYYNESYCGYKDFLDTNIKELVELTNHI